MIVERLAVGLLECNCYLVACPKTRKAMIIDPGGDEDRILERVESLSLEPVRIVLTHTHADHIAAVGALKSAFPSAVFSVHRNESEWLESPRLNLSVLLGMPFKAPPADDVLTGDDTVTVGTLCFDVLEVPGHSPGSVALSAPGVVFSGDVLFDGSIGRTDLSTGSFPELIHSIRTQLLVLPDDTVVYPGHGDATTIGREKVENPFLQ